jgi:DNA-binding response OmpR family regulator
MDAPANGTVKTILIAEDNLTLLKPVAAMLGKSGYSVITAIDGKDALQKFRAFAGTIDVIVADINMPFMTGIELAAEVNREKTETKILLISALDAESLVRARGWDFLGKPFEFVQLREMIQHLLIDHRENGVCLEY